MYDHRIISGDTSNILSLCGEGFADRYAGKTVLITGVNGLIGSYILFSLMAMNDKLSAGIQICAITRSKKRAFEKFPFLDQRQDIKIIEHELGRGQKFNFEFDVVFHAASPTDPNSFNQDPVGTIKANVLGAIEILDVLKDKEQSSFIFISTREIYGENIKDSEFVSENDYGPLDPTELRSCYPESKRLVETICRAYSSQHGVHTKIARVAHTFGPGMRLSDGRVLGDFLGAVINGEDIVLKGTGETRLAPTYISEVIKGIFLIASIDDELVYNVASSSDVITVLGLAKKIVEVSEKKLTVSTSSPSSEILQGYLKIQPGFLDSSKLVRHGWQCEVSLEEGIQRTLDFFGD